MNGWRWWLLAIYALVVSVVIIEMGRPSDLSWFVLSIPFLLWALAPVALLCFGPGLRVARLIGAVLVCVLGALAYVHTAFVAKPDAQGGLIFLFAPVYQFGIAVLWLLGGWVFARFYRKGHSGA